MKRTNTEQIHGIILSVLLLFMGLGGTARGADVAFSATVDGQVKVVSVDAFQSDGEAYVSLEKLMRQFGGTTREAPGKATIDFGGRSVVVTLNGTRVSTSSDTFDLGHPVKEADGGPYIAVSDLSKLFADAFKTPITQGAPTAAPPVDSKDVEEDLDLLEDVTTSDTPASLPTTEPTSTDDPATISPSGGFVVVVDAGHGGSDPGVVSPDGTMEKDVALRVALAMQSALASAEGIQAILTRTEDKELSVLERASVAVKSKPNLLISIHAGASTSTTAQGFEIFAPAGGSSTGGGITASLSAESVALGKIAEQALAKNTGATSRGVHSVALRLLGDVAAPGMLVEVGMLTTPSEEATLASADYAGKVAAGLVEVVQQASARAKGGQ